MKTPGFVLLMMAGAGLFAADWLSDGGNPSRDNWQSREKGLTAANIKGLKLLWKKELPESAVTAPVILGSIITHRGIKELVFVEGASSTVYSVDADLGRIFWTRKFEVGAPCAGMPVTPVITPEKVRTPEDGEGHTPLRPIYFAAADGVVHKVLPTTGEDMGPGSGGCGKPLEVAPFVPPGTSKFPWQGREVFLKGKGATYLDSRGTRWVYTATPDGLQASMYGGAKAWSAPGLGEPVIANGMVFALSNRGTIQLNVLDAKTGNFLYSSGENLATADHSSSLALANGHVCFTTSANVLYCFGIPIEI
jgi:outer membrane protein assembly factor BamB